MKMEIKFKSLLLVAALAVLTQGCAKKEQKTLAKSSRMSRVPYGETNGVGTNGWMPAVNSPAGNTGKVWAAATQGNLSSRDFDRSVKMFVSATLDGNTFGTVSGMPNANTGIRFWGSIGTVNPVSTTTYNYTQVTSYSAFQISIWDSLTNTKDLNGQIIPEYSVFFEGNVSGQIYGTYAEVRVEDQYGNITLRGDILGANFKGYISFENNQYYDGAAPGAAANDIWAFTVPTCSFFNCQ